MKLNKISADMVSRRPDQTAEWLNRLARQVDIVEASAAASSKKPGDLPIATTYSLGVVKIGQNLSITPEGVLSALAPTSYNYELLFNKPKINNVELIGNKSLSDLGIDIPTKTSELINDGADNTSTYVEHDELAAVATSGAYSDLSGTPTKTSDFINDGSDSTSVYVELDELANVATSGAYADLSGKPTNLSDFNNDVGYITSASLPTKTSELQNDGSDGTSTYVEADELATVATTGNYSDLNGTPTKTSDFLNDGSDGTSTYVEADELATVATTGSYSDLLNKPTIGNATLTIQRNGTTAQTFTANSTANKSVDIQAPIRVDMSGSAQTSSWHRSVIALCEVTTADKVEFNSYSSGKITFHRSNGLDGVAYIDVYIENAYYGAYAFNFSYASNLNLLTSTTAGGTSTGFRPCVFKKNDVWYAGVEFYLNPAQYQRVVFDGECKGINIFGLDYFSPEHTSGGTTYPDAVLDQEVYDSLDFTKVTWKKETLMTKSLRLEDGTIKKGSSYTATLPNKTGTLAMTSDIGNATLTIQKNATNIDTFTANATSNKTINITVPTTAADVNALPDSTKYAASLSLSINSSTFVITGQLKDQDGNNLGSAQTIDLPLESVVVSGSYDSATKEVVLVLENGSEIRFSVADLVSGLQTEITSANPLDADLVDDSTSTNKFVTSSDITTWNGKQDALTAGSNIQINGTTISATDTTYSAGSGISLNGTTFSADTSVVQEKLTAGSNIQINGATISATDTTYSVMTGADSGTAGTSGLVPAPAAGDDTKFLSGDGLWKTVSQYSLPIASSSTLGGIKVGNGLAIDSGTGVLSTDNIFKITVTGFTGTTPTYDITLDQTFEDILAAYQAGKTLILSADIYRVPDGGYSANESFVLQAMVDKVESNDYTTAIDFEYVDANGSSSSVHTKSHIFSISKTQFPGSPASYGYYYTIDEGSADVYNATLTIQKNGANVQTFTANQSSNATANITVPTKTSDITNDSGFVTSSGTVAKADQLTNARTIAIGTGATGTATSFNGTSNITIPITDVKDAYVTWGGKALAQNVTPDDMGCIDEFGHNKLAFLPASCITVEYTTDGGTTWLDYGMTDAQKIAMVTTSGSGVQIGKGTATVSNGTLTDANCGNYQSRVTICTRDGNGNGKLYTSAVKWLINFTSDGTTGCKVKLETLTIGNYNNHVDTWVDKGSYDVSGWSGWNSIPYATSFGGSTNQTSHIAAIRFTLSITSVGTSTTSVAGMIDFRLIGKTNWNMPSEMARAGHIYTVDIYQNAFFPNGVLPKTDSTYSLGTSSYKWKNLYLSGSIYHGSAQLSLPPTAGTLALTSDIPTVNNATLTIQKNSTNVATFTANASSNVTANISVPTKTSELTNDSGFITNTTTQDFAVQEGSTNPVFDDMTPIKTFTWTVADTTYRPVYQFDNTGWAYDNMDMTVAYRITVTGSSISQITDVIDRWFSPTSWPVTSVMCRTLSTSAATTGYRYLRAVYPTSSGLNNNTYKFGQEIANYNATSRTVKVEVFKTATGVTWNETKPAGPIYTNSTYQATNAMSPYATRGWMFRAAASLNATSADAATRVSNYESATINSSAIKSGAALTAGYIGFQATDGKVYMITNTTANMACDENARIGYITNAYNANTAIDTRYLRSVTNIGSTQVGYIPHATMALGDRLYLRCTMDSSGNIHSDNYLATSMTAGYTWLPFGTATASNTIYMDVRKPTFYTLDASGRLVRVNGQPTGIEQAAFVGNTLSPAPGVFVYTNNLADGSVTADKISKPSLLDFFYPVGSYYETSDITFNPNNSWGGTWVEDTAGKVLVAKDSGTFATVGDTGGLEETTITNDNIPQGLISVSHVAAMESEFYSGGIVTKGRGDGLQREGSSTTLSTTTYSHTYTFGKSTPDAMTNLQPYTVVKRWHRTA